MSLHFFEVDWRFTIHTLGEVFKAVNEMKVIVLAIDFIVTNCLI